MQKRSESTRNLILETANQLFSKFGYEATGVAEICKAAGVSKGAFYHHFPSKQDIFMELLTSYLNNIEAGFNLMRREIQDVPEAILQMAGMAGSLFQSANIHLPIFLEFWSQANHDPLVWEATVAPFHRYQSYFADMIQDGIDRGSIQPVDPQLAGRVLVSLAVGLLMESLFNPQITNWQSETQHSLQLLMNGFVRREK